MSATGGPKKIPADVCAPHSNWCARNLARPASTFTVVATTVFASSSLSVVRPNSPRMPSISQTIETTGSRAWTTVPTAEIGYRRLIADSATWESMRSPSQRSSTAHRQTSARDRQRLRRNPGLCAEQDYVGAEYSDADGPLPPGRPEVSVYRSVRARPTCSAHPFRSATSTEKSLTRSPSRPPQSATVAPIAPHATRTLPSSSLQLQAIRSEPASAARRVLTAPGRARRGRAGARGIRDTSGARAGVAVTDNPRPGALSWARERRVAEHSCRFATNREGSRGVTFQPPTIARRTR